MRKQEGEGVCISFSRTGRCRIGVLKGVWRLFHSSLMSVGLLGEIMGECMLTLKEV